MNTYIIRNTAGQITDSRSSGTMHYSHAVVDPKDGRAFSWHLTEAAAVKTQRSNLPITSLVVQVEEHQGAKATVLKRLAKAEAEAEKAEQEAIAGAEVTEEAPAKKAPAKKVAAAEKAPAKKAIAKAEPKRKTLSGLTHPADTWTGLLIAKELSVAEAERAMNVPLGALYRVTKRGALPKVELVLAFAKLTDQDAEALWTEVTTFELAEARKAAAKKK